MIVDYFGKDLSRLKKKKLFLFDMDGTIYMEGKLFAGVTELLDKIVENGGQYVFITNNSSKSVSDYIERLSKMGIPFTRSANLRMSTTSIIPSMGIPSDNSTVKKFFLNFGYAMPRGM